MTENKVIPITQEKNKGGNPRWKKGVSGNPKGRPPGLITELSILKDAIEKARVKKQKHILRHFVERAYENDAVLIALVKKFIPDKTQADFIIKHFLYERYKDKTPEQLQQDAVQLANKILEQNRINATN